MPKNILQISPGINLKPGEDKDLTYLGTIAFDNGEPDNDVGVDYYQAPSEELANTAKMRLTNLYPDTDIDCVSQAPSQDEFDASLNDFARRGIDFAGLGEQHGLS